MGSYTLESMMDKIIGYSDVLSKFGFVNVGSGDKPWSTKSVHKDGSYIEHRSSDWTFYNESHREIVTGPNPKSLDEYLTIEELKNEVSKM